MTPNAPPKKTYCTINDPLRLKYRTLTLVRLAETHIAGKSILNGKVEQNGSVLGPRNMIVRWGRVLPDYIIRQQPHFESTRPYFLETILPSLLGFLAMGMSAARCFRRASATWASRLFSVRSFDTSAWSFFTCSSAGIFLWLPLPAMWTAPVRGGRNQ